MEEAVLKSHERNPGSKSAPTTVVSGEMRGLTIVHFGVHSVYVSAIALTTSFVGAEHRHRY